MKQSDDKTDSLALVFFCNSLVTRERFEELMRDENEKEAYLESLRES